MVKEIKYENYQKDYFEALEKHSPQAFINYLKKYAGKVYVEDSDGKCYWVPKSSLKQFEELKEVDQIHQIAVDILYAYKNKKVSKNAYEWACKWLEQNDLKTFNSFMKDLYKQERSKYASNNDRT